MSLWPTGRSFSFCAACAGTSYATHVPKVGCFPPFPEPHPTLPGMFFQTLTPTILPWFLLILEISAQRPALVHLKPVLASSTVSPPVSSSIALFVTYNCLIGLFSFSLLQTSSSGGLMDLACHSSVHSDAFT